MIKSVNIKNVYRQSWIEIDLDAVAQNVRHIRSYLGKIRYLAVVKANAYGLGAVKVARTIMENGADLLGLVTLDECIELRRAGISAPLMNMGPVLPDQADTVLDHDIEQMVYQPELLGALSERAQERNQTAHVHFKVDTGMSRYGIHFSKAVEAITAAHQLPGLKIVGVMTHFPMSDELDKSFALLQIERFRKIKQDLEHAGISIPCWHMANSGGVLDLPGAHFDMVRVGIMNYGYWPSSKVRRPFELTPAMHVKSRIVEVRTVNRGDTVGYGRRFLAEKPERIGVLPLGYADGYDRKIRMGGYVLWQGIKVPIVSGLCMDAMFLRLTDFPEIKVGDTVTIMGINNGAEISPHDIADLTGTVSYEVISNFGRRLPRVYFRNGKIESVVNELLRE